MDFQKAYKGLPGLKMAYITHNAIWADRRVVSIIFLHIGDKLWDS